MESKGDMPVELTREECLNLEYSLGLEWLETNGLGAYASSTPLNCHTRKYHGLLVTPVEGLPGKYVLLSKMEPGLTIRNKAFHLSTNKYPGVFHPTGHQYIDSFTWDPCPQTVWRAGTVILKQSIMMVQGWNGILIRYELLEADKNVTLQLTPFLAYRDFHGLTRENMDLQVKTYQVKPKEHKVEPYPGMPPLFFTASHKTTFYPGPDWACNAEYWEENSRGFPYQEDLFLPGFFERKMKAGDDFYLAVSPEPLKAGPAKLWSKETERRKAVATKFRSESHLPTRHLKIRSEQYLVDYGSNRLSITAGFPWFGEWGRDTLIALPGLTLYTKQPEKALTILKTLGSYEKDGVIPNILGPGGKSPSYNSLDASLWFFWAVWQYHSLSGNKKETEKELLPVLENVLLALMEGRHAWARIREDGLLEAGNEGTQLTWMDATVGGKPVTPRHGVAVDINALWLNALFIYMELYQQIKGGAGDNWKDVLTRGTSAFRDVFWSDERGHLADVVNIAGQDLSFRPNQLLAISLPYSLLSKKDAEQVLEKVTRELVTPYGLRSLAPKNPLYRGSYRGGPEERDGAYHQGTVWGWLVGPYVEAGLKTAKDKKAEAKRLLKTFELLFNQVTAHGLGGVSEIFDGNPPYKARGCPFQAWSAAECIRAHALIEEALI